MNAMLQQATALSSNPVLPVATPMQAGYGMALTDAGAFEQALARLSPTQGRSSPAMQALFSPLEQINAESSRLSTLARASTSEGTPLTPGEMVSLTVKCHEFMFHCQLTSSVANRTSDGLQQLFRQQS